MLVMNAGDLRGVDLNLLVVFQALMEERSTTRAAERLHVSQSAVSAALKRLRSIFDDPLFERDRQGMRPTFKALSAAPTIGSALGGIASVVFASSDFDPSTSRRPFHLAMSDDIEAVIAPQLLRLRGQQAWKVRFSIHQTNSTVWEKTLEDPKIDLLIGMTPTQVPAEFSSQVLFAGGYTCLFDPRQLADVTMPLTLQDFADLDHVRVAYDGQRGTLDGLFEAEGLERRDVLTLSHFGGLPPILQSSKVIATVPTHVAKILSRSSGLSTTPPPVQMPPYTVSAVWRGRTSTQELQWLRALLTSVVHY